MPDVTLTKIHRSTLDFENNMSCSVAKFDKNILKSTEVFYRGRHNI